MKYSHHTFNLSYSEDFDPSLLPIDCQKITPDAFAIMSRMLSGETLPGVCLCDDRGNTIRPKKTEEEKF